MKKIILFLLIISCIFIKPNIDVKADASVPVITAYEAIITNPDGAKTYKGEWISENSITDVVIPYNQEVMVVSEYANSVQVKYNNVKYSISKDDITLKNGEYSLSNAEHLDEKVYVLIPYGTIDMYSGPSNKFKKITSIPKGTEVGYEYKIKDSSWIYVEYNNNKGWISAAGDKGAGFIFPERVNYNVVALEDFDLNGNHISKGTVLKCLYYLVFGGSGPDTYSYYVEYNNKMEVINFSQIDSPLVEKTNAQVEQSSEPEKTDEKEDIDEQNITDDKQIEPLTSQQNSNFDYTTIIYLCIGAAVLIALTSMVTIILINKKNKGKVSNESQSITNEENVEK